MERGKEKLKVGENAVGNIPRGVVTHVPISEIIKMFKCRSEIQQSCLVFSIILSMLRAQWSMIL